MKRIALFVVGLLYLLTTTSFAETILWNYNKYYYNKLTGFKLYSGTEEGNYPTLVTTIQKSDIVIVSEQPILLEEHFNTDPGSKYNITRGSWTWVEETKNMKVESDEFMVVFEYPAGVNSSMSFWYWPEKSSGDQPILYSYIKDEAMYAETGLGSYYELRFAGVDGIRYSNWRKCYDGKYGGVDGAKSLSRYEQCNIVEGQENICYGFRISMDWSSEYYGVSILNQKLKTFNDAYGEDSKPLNINKLEIIVNQQSFWIDDIIIGGAMTLSKEINLGNTSPVYYAMTAMVQDPNDSSKVIESGMSIPTIYTATEGGPPKALQNFKVRKK